MAKTKTDKLVLTGLLAFLGYATCIICRNEYNAYQNNNIIREMDPICVKIQRRSQEGPAYINVTYKGKDGNEYITSDHSYDGIGDADEDGIDFVSRLSPTYDIEERIVGGIGTIPKCDKDLATRKHNGAVARLLMNDE